MGPRFVECAEEDDGPPETEGPEIEAERLPCSVVRRPDPRRGGELSSDASDDGSSDAGSRPAGGIAEVAM